METSQQEKLIQRGQGRPPKRARREEQHHEAVFSGGDGGGGGEASTDTLSTISNILQRLPEPPICVGGPADSLPPLPGLLVKGRPVSLPLSDSDAAFLREEGSPSPHGQGFDTIIDPRVRSSKEFAPQDVSFAHPSWNERISSLAQQVAIQLGAAPTRTETETTLEARPYKLLFYGEGDHFLPHRDTEKESGMFATLIIQLPSRCTGGALLVHHNGKDT